MMEPKSTVLGLRFPGAQRLVRGRRGRLLLFRSGRSLDACQPDSTELNKAGSTAISGQGTRIEIDRITTARFSGSIRVSIVHLRHSCESMIPPGVNLDGRLLGLSYGTGSVYLILEDEVNGVHQGGVVPLPIKVPTGLMSGRFSPSDGSLYLCGLVGWSSDAPEDGGLYRVSPAGPLPPMPLDVQAVSDGLVLTFSQPLGPEAQEVGRWDVEAWNYLWSERYGVARDHACR